jgi:VWFA-related protein
LNAPSVSGQVRAPAGGNDTLRVSTRLVQIDVVVRDDDGPVDGLTVDDFTVYDGGERRSISTFDLVRSGEESATIVSADTLPLNAISNRPRTRGPEPASASILLLDRLNTETVDQPYSNGQAREFVESLDAGHQVAIYELNRELRLVQDYTDDREALARALARVDLRVSGELEASYGAGATGGFESNRNEVGLDPDLVQAQTAGAGLSERGTLELDQMVAEYFLNDRIRVTADVLEAIARHMTRLPGRKNLMWLAGRFPFSFEPRSHFSAGETSAATLRQLERTARAITDSNVAVYPISAVGLLAPEFNRYVLCLCRTNVTISPRRDGV